MSKSLNLIFKINGLKIEEELEIEDLLGARVPIDRRPNDYRE